MNFDNIKEIDHMLNSTVICAIEIEDENLNLKALNIIRVILKGLLSKEEISTNVKLIV